MSAFRFCFLKCFDICSIHIILLVCFQSYLSGTLNIITRIYYVNTKTLLHIFFIQKDENRLNLEKKNQKKYNNHIPFFFL